MRIAINTRFWSYEYQEGYGNFTREICTRLIREHPGDTFILISDKAIPAVKELGPHVIPVVLTPSPRHPLLWKYWYDFLIPRVLKKYKADVFFSPDGFCSLHTKVPQCLVIHDLAFIHFPGYIPKSHNRYYRSHTPKMIKKAKRLITVSHFSKQDIISIYPFAEEKIDVIYNAASDVFHPLPEYEKDETKAKYSEGKEYFLCIGAIHPRKNLINLLKAFSWFKKRQQSQMQLLITGRLAWQYDEFVQKLNTFKYRSDVKMTGYVSNEELVQIIGSAYALVYPSQFEGFGLPVVEAMQSGIPVAASKSGAIKEVAGEAALFFDPENSEQMGQQMAMLYKDEILRYEYVELGLARASEFSWDRSASAVWESLVKTAGQ